MHKQLTILTAALVFGGWQAHSAQSDVEALDPGKTVLVEAEWFRFHGDWVPAGRLGQTMLWTMAGEDDPITVIEIRRASRRHSLSQ
jgi:hypothetical protein